MKTSLGNAFVVTDDRLHPT